MSVSPKIQVWDGTSYSDIGGPPGPTDFVNTGPVTPQVRGTGDIWVDDSQVLLSWDDNWRYPTLLNGWVNYGNDGTNYQVVRYRKTLGGLVVVEGLVKNGAAGTSVMWVMPPGYRPTLEPIFAQPGFAWPNINRIDVEPTGNVKHYNGSGAWVSVCFTYYAYQ